MDSTARAGWSTGARLNWLLALSVLAPALIIALGAVVVNQLVLGASNAASTATGLPAQTLFWIVTLATLALVTLIIAGAWLAMRSTVRRQALELADVCRQMISGASQARAVVVGDDEFAVLSAAVNAVLDGAPSVATTAAVEPAPAAPQDAASIQQQIEKLLQEVSAVGDGDLRVQAEVTPDTLGVLADSFNYMIEELAKVVGRVQATTIQVTNATRRLLDRSAEVSNASEAQALQIGQTSDAVARLADFVQLSANNALAAADTAREALRSAEGGQQAVTQTINGMTHIRDNVQETSKKIKRLGERSQEVSEIVRLIEDIAEQTNLLALNAAIQSAMAGEHGRGFAVVADEIRLLNERVTEATKKISTIVKSIQGDTYEAVVAMEESTQEVVSGSRLADEAGDALRNIFSAVDRQAKMIEGIARAASDRAQTAETVASSMGRISELTRQTTIATQDTTASVSYLAELAEQLRASVATFRLPEHHIQNATAPALGQGPSQSQAAYPPMFNLPNLDASPWNNGLPGGAPVPALPPGPAGGYANGGYEYNEYGAGYDGYEDYYTSGGLNGQPVPSPYVEQNYGDPGAYGGAGSGAAGSSPFPDLF